MRKLLSILILGLLLSPPARPQSTQAAISMNNAIQDLARLANPADPASHVRGANSFVNYHGEKEDTKGSRLLFNDWPKGFVIGLYDTVLKNPNLFLNYDKITHDLYFTLDGKTIVKVETSQARELHFIDSGKETILIRVDGIDPRVFYQRLSDSAGTNHYTLYRLLKTQFRHSDYRTDGLVTTGNNYDEYVDDYQYYLVMLGGREYSPLALNKRSLRGALGAKAEHWLKTHRQDKIDEPFLIGLINRLNQ